MRKQILILCFMLIIITVVTYFAEKNKILFYEWYRALYVIPIIWFGFLYGKIGSIPVAIGVTTLYVPILGRDVEKFGFGEEQVSLFFSMLGIIVLGVLIGHFAGRERKLRIKSTLLSEISLKFRSLFDENLIYENLLSELIGIIEAEEGILCLKEGKKLIPKKIITKDNQSSITNNRKKSKQEHTTSEMAPPKVESQPDKWVSEIAKKNILYKVAEVGNPLISNGVIEDERFILYDSKIKNLIVLPIKSRGETIGVIGLANKKGDVLFSKYDLNLSQTIIQSAVAAIENLKLFEEKMKIKNIFSTYVTTPIAEEILKEPDKLKPGGKKCEVTVLFADIRGFTSIAEKLSPEEVISHLNEYFSAMIDIIFKYEGTLDKFIGDCIMCYWGAPLEVSDHAERAIRCAFEMQEKLKELNVKWQKEGKPLFDIGIGINTGEVVAGNIGDIRKMEYTVIGDNVNLAQRLEGLCRNFQSKILIPESTYSKIKDLVEVKKLPQVEVKGKSEKIAVYEVLNLKNENN